MARPGLYDELKKFKVLEQGAAIALGEGTDADKAALLEDLLGSVGSQFSVTPRAVFVLRKDRLPREAPAPEIKGKRRPNSGSFQKGKPGGPGAPRGHENATKTGLYRNPLLHRVSEERQALVRLPENATPADTLRHNIEVYQLSIADMTEEIEAIKASAKRWWWQGSTYRRQDGDGELMGTGRISERKRLPREEALKEMVKARAAVQGKLDQALTKLHDMINPGKGGAPINNVILIQLQQVVRESVLETAARAPRDLAEVNERFPLPPPPAGFRIPLHDA